MVDDRTDPIPSAPTVSIPTARFEGTGTPRGPLASYPSFSAAIAGRLAQGAVEYGDRSFHAHPDTLCDELEQELLDVAGWAFILWTRVRGLRGKMDGYLTEGTRL